MFSRASEGSLMNAEVSLTPARWMLSREPVCTDWVKLVTLPTDV